MPQIKTCIVKETRRIVPSQNKGGKSDVRYSIKAFGEVEARKIYERARRNLLDINNWQILSGKFSAAFFLTDPFGKHVQRLPLQGDYIKIHLPISSEDKFDWVRIEGIEEQKSHTYFNWVTIRVRPSEAPKEKEETEHFFSKEATSSFSVERSGRKVEASVKGRNELPNTNTRGIFNKIRNAVIAIAAIAGLNTPQWSGLVKGIVTK